MKARLKSIVLSAIGVLATFTAVTYTSCNNDPCKAIVCAYGGTCNEGECICPSGFEGTHCEIVTKDKFVGVWTVFEDGTITQPAQYEINILSGEGNTDVKISNFYNSFPPGQYVNGRVVGDSIYIFSPTNSTSGFKVSGYGLLEWEEFYPEHGKLTMYYTITNAEGKTNDFGVNGGVASEWNR
ncbi:MAG: calcium-binding EGF-like domain-containing protein [Chitinophagales bacterium]|nr:calcium-binding EGF-like domain-containing protein [Chitinophagales bacterium]